MHLVSWSVVNNEIDFLPDIISYHMEFIDIMYFLDTGSTDGTLEYLKEQIKVYPNQIIIEEYPTKYIPQYELNWEEMTNPFPEVEVRNYAINQAEKLCNDDSWLIQLDGDEIFLPIVHDVIEHNNKFSVIAHSTINPVEDLDKHPLERRLRKPLNGVNEKVSLYDPHARIWRPGIGIKYINNPAFGTNQFHCIPVFQGKHLYNCAITQFVSDPVFHFHLHWMYGKKLEKFYNKKEITNRLEMKKNNMDNRFSNFLPQLFFDRQSQWIKYE